MTRTIALLSTLFLATTAHASQPGACQELSSAETAFFDAKDEVGRLIDVAFGDDFNRKIASAPADERDGLVQQREDARKELRQARKDRRAAKKALKQAEGDVDASGVVCTPAPEDDEATT